jgi:hypothetical protein
MRHSAATSAARQSAQAAGRHGTRGALPSTAHRPRTRTPRAQWRRAAAGCGKLLCCVAKMVYCGCKDGVRYLLGDGGEGDRPRQPDLPRRAVRAHAHTHRARAPAGNNRRLPPTHFADTVAVGLLSMRGQRAAAASVRRGSAALGHSVHRRYRMQRERDWQDALARDAHLYAIARQECAPISRSASTRLQHSYWPARALAPCCTHRGIG